MKTKLLIRVGFSVCFGFVYYFYLAAVLEAAFSGLRPLRIAISVSSVVVAFILTYILPLYSNKDVMSASRDKIIAQEHSVPAYYLSNDLKGFIIGESDGKYVTIPFEESPEHMLEFGSPGTGKTNSVKSTMLANFNIVDSTQRFHAVFAVDVKPELSLFTVYEDRGDIRIINPSKIGTWGFNPFFELSPNCSDDELKSRCILISQSLIQDSGDAKGRYFTDNARKILNAALMYGFRLGFSLAESIVYLIDVTADNLIPEILESSEMENHPKIKGLVRSFANKTSEGFQDIVMTLERDLDIFQVESVKSCFSKNNPKRVTPHDLVEGISVFLAIPDHKLIEYAPIFRLLLTLTMNYLTSIPANKKIFERPIWILVDEAGSIGAIPQLEEVLARGRSRGIQVTLICQSYFQLEKTYGHDGARIILDCCKTTIVLSCSNTETAKMLSEWCGEYRETKISNTTRNNGSVIKRSDSINESVEYRPILSVADIKTLEGDGKVLVFVKGNWFMISSLPYYKIKRLKKLSDQIVAHNASLDANDEDKDNHFETTEK